MNFNRFSTLTRLTILLILLTAGLFLLTLLFSSGSSVILSLLILAGLCGTACCVTTGVIRCFARKLSPYLAVALADAVIGLGILAFSLYDISHAVGLLAGMLGTMLMITALPFCAVLFLVMILIWFIKRR